MPCLGFRTNLGWLSNSFLVKKKSWKLVPTGAYPGLHIGAGTLRLCVTL